eukprot:7018313-Pyramimonas_sp.AAC.1
MPSRTMIPRGYAMHSIARNSMAQKSTVERSMSEYGVALRGELRHHKALKRKVLKEDNAE